MQLTLPLYLSFFSALLDRVFLSLLLLLLLYLFPIFPTPFASLLRVLFLAGPLAVPWIRATRANAALRRKGVFILLSGPLRATKVGPRDMEVELRCEDSELFVVKRVRLRETVLQGITHAHALCVRKGDSIVALEIVVRGKLLVGADGVREKVLRELCGAASRLDV